MQPLYPRPIPVQKRGTGDGRSPFPPVSASPSFSGSGQIVSKRLPAVIIPRPASAACRLSGDSGIHSARIAVSPVTAVLNAVMSEIKNGTHDCILFPLQYECRGTITWRGFDAAFQASRVAYANFGGRAAAEAAARAGPCEILVTCANAAASAVFGTVVTAIRGIVQRQEALHNAGKPASFARRAAPAAVPLLGPAEDAAIVGDEEDVEPTRRQPIRSALAASTVVVLEKRGPEMDEDDVAPGCESMQGHTAVVPSFAEKAVSFVRNDSTAPTASALQLLSPAEDASAALAVAENSATEAVEEPTQEPINSALAVATVAESGNRGPGCDENDVAVAPVCGGGGGSGELLPSKEPEMSNNARAGFSTKFADSPTKDENRAIRRERKEKKRKQKKLIVCVDEPVVTEEAAAAATAVAATDISVFSERAGKSNRSIQSGSELTISEPKDPSAGVVSADSASKSQTKKVIAPSKAPRNAPPLSETEAAAFVSQLAVLALLKCSRAGAVRKYCATPSDGRDDGCSAAAVEPRERPPALSLHFSRLSMSAKGWAQACEVTWGAGLMSLSGLLQRLRCLLDKPLKLAHDKSAMMHDGEYIAHDGMAGLALSLLPLVGVEGVRVFLNSRWVSCCPSLLSLAAAAATVAHCFSRSTTGTAVRDSVQADVSSLVAVAAPSAASDTIVCPVEGGAHSGGQCSDIGLRDGGAATDAPTIGKKRSRERSPIRMAAAEAWAAAPSTAASTAPFDARAASSSVAVAMAPLPIQFVDSESGMDVFVPAEDEVGAASLPALSMAVLTASASEGFTPAAPTTNAPLPPAADAPQPLVGDSAPAQAKRPRNDDLDLLSGSGSESRALPTKSAIRGLPAPALLSEHATLMGWHLGAHDPQDALCACTECLQQSSSKRIRYSYRAVGSVAFVAPQRPPNPQQLRLAEEKRLTTEARAHEQAALLEQDRLEYERAIAAQAGLHAPSSDCGLPPLPLPTSAQFSSADPFTVLALPRDIPLTPAMIRRRYRALALLVHPDRVATAAPSSAGPLLLPSTDFFVAVSRAYDALMRFVKVRR